MSTACNISIDPNCIVNDAPKDIPLAVKETLPYFCYKMQGNSVVQSHKYEVLTDPIVQ